MRRLAQLCAAAEIPDTESSALIVDVASPMFEERWDPFVFWRWPAGAYVAGQGDVRLEVLSGARNDRPHRQSRCQPQPGSWWHDVDAPRAQGDSTRTSHRRRGQAVDGSDPAPAKTYHPGRTNLVCGQLIDRGLHPELDGGCSGIPWRSDRRSVHGHEKVLAGGQV